MDRRCQACMLKDIGYRLDHYDRGTDTRRELFYAKYSRPDGKRLWLWHSQFCNQCAYDGNVLSRMTFSMKTLSVDTSQKKVDTSQKKVDLNLCNTS